MLENEAMHTPIPNGETCVNENGLGPADRIDAMAVIFHSAVDPIIQMDGEGKMQFVNAACLKTFNYEKEDLIGGDVKMLMLQNCQASPDEQLQKLLRKGKKKLQGLKSDGSVFPMSLSLSEVKIYGETIFTGFIHDLSEDEKEKEKFRLILAEREQSEELLLNLVPESISKRLKELKSNEHIADYFENVTILFVDVAGFTKFSSTRSPVEIVHFLNMFFQGLDKLVDKYGLEKIKTIGDAYMAVSGLTMEKNHTRLILDFAIDVLQFVEEMNVDNPFAPDRLGVRIGIGTGSVVAGVVGSKKRFFDLWGDAVNTASRMESTGVESCIQCTKDVALVASEYPDRFAVVNRGSINVKGKGEMEVFLIGDKKSEQRIQERLLRHCITKRRESVITYEKMSKEFSPFGGRLRYIWVPALFSAGLLVGKFGLRK